MRRLDVRTVLWIVAAAASLAVAWGARALVRSDDAGPVFAAILIEAVLCILGALVFIARASRAPAAHTRARWRVLDALRVLVAVLLYGFILGEAIALLLGFDPRQPSFEAHLLAPAAACVLALAGAVLERERIHLEDPQAPSVARKLYETRSGAVVEIRSPHGREVVLQGRHGVEKLTDVERAIDERRWEDAERPSAESLESALRRWGQLDRSDPP